jgi:hypothetical protein
LQLFAWQVLPPLQSPSPQQSPMTQLLPHTLPVHTHWWLPLQLLVAPVQSASLQQLPVTQVPPHIIPEQSHFPVAGLQAVTPGQLTAVCLHPLIASQLSSVHLSLSSQLTVLVAHAPLLHVFIVHMLEAPQSLSTQHVALGMHVPPHIMPEHAQWGGEPVHV